MKTLAEIKTVKEASNNISAFEVARKRAEWLCIPISTYVQLMTIHASMLSDEQAQTAPANHFPAVPQNGINKTSSIRRPAGYFAAVAA